MHPCVNGCIQITKAIPLVFILAVIGWSYYAYVVAMCIYAIPATNIGEKVILLIFYHLFLGIFVWAYAQTIISRPMKPPEQFHLSHSDWEFVQSTIGNAEAAERRNEFLQSLLTSRQLPVFARANANSIRLCESCRLLKPDRAHHCSTCRQCLLKMDHHCPWVNNCVGFHNYKFFIQFLVYGSLYCFYVGGTSAKYFANFWVEGVSDLQAYRFHVLFMFFAAWMFSLSLIFLGGYHVYLAARNRTTLETFRAPVLSTGPDKRAYDMGVRRNYQQVFGDSWLLWLLPIRSRHMDGVTWPHRVTLAASTNYASMSSGSQPETPPPAAPVGSSRADLLPSDSPHNYDLEANR